MWKKQRLRSSQVGWKLIDDSFDIGILMEEGWKNTFLARYLRERRDDIAKDRSVSKKDRKIHF